MNITEIQDEVKNLSLDERRQLSAFLVSLRDRESADYLQKLAEKIDCKDDGKWASFEEFDERISR